MTETQITFANINVGDKLHTISPCGTERVGVANFVTGTYVDDAGGLIIAHPSWTIYRIEPAFTPLPIPEEKQWIRATLKDGRVKSGEVQEVLDHSAPRAKNNTVPCMGIVIDGREFFVLLAAPPEPNWFGYVGYVTTPEGEVWDMLRGYGGDFELMRRGDGTPDVRYYWTDVLTLGTFTAVKP